MHTERQAVLRHFGFSPRVVERLMEGLARDVPPVCPDPALVVPGNELFVPDWIACCLDARRRGAVPALRDVLFELNFPIAGGVSGTLEYQSLALAGGSGLEDVRKSLTLPGPEWEAPERMRVFMHDTGAGLLPVIHAAARADFVTLVRAIVHRNEPAPVPASMGSSFINGYNNRTRYLRVREALAAGVMKPEARNPQLWKDRLLLLASGPYSGVGADKMGLEPDEWVERSTTLRLHHESCHYVVRRLFPKLKFGLQDELIADFAGLMGATGEFRAKDFLLFMGLERYPEYRPGGRLENYPRECGGDAETLNAAGRLLVEAAESLERFFASWDPLRFIVEKARVLAVLTFLPLEALAAPDASATLRRMLSTSEKERSS